MKNLFRKTKSPCPVCKKILEADIIEENGSMFLQKKCPKHGDFEVKIAKYAWYYKGLNNYYDNIFGANFSEKRQCIIYTSITGWKCNLNCPICYTPPSEKIEKVDIPISEFKKNLEAIKNKRKTIHLSGGGEPTMRDDLPEIIRLISESGNTVGLFTNGVKIANDLNYLKQLKKSGLNYILLWLDTLKNEEIHRKLRGGDFIPLKMKVLEYMKKEKVAGVIFQVLARGINESEVPDFIEFIRRNEFIGGYWIRGYNYLGNFGLSPVQEYNAMDEIIELVANQSRGLFSLEDFYYWQKINYTLAVIGNCPRCYRAQTFFIPRHNEKSLRETFCFPKFSSVLDEFEKIWLEDKERAKEYFLSKFYLKLFKNPKLFYLFRIRPRFSKFDWNGFFPPSKHYFLIQINSIYSLLNLDIDRTKKECFHGSFNLGPENNFPRCFELAEF